MYIVEDENRRTELVLDTPKTKNSIREIYDKQRTTTNAETFKKNC